MLSPACKEHIFDSNHSYAGFPTLNILAGFNILRILAVNILERFCWLQGKASLPFKINLVPSDFNLFPLGEGDK